MLPRYDTSLLGPWARKLPARPVTVPGPRQRQLHEVASVQRQLGDLLRVDQLAPSDASLRCSVTVSAHARDRDLRGERGDFQREVQREALPGLPGRPCFSLLCLETGHRRRDGIGADRQQRQDIASFFVGGDFADRSGSLVTGRDQRTAYGAARFVQHGSGDGADRLCKCGRRCKAGDNKRQSCDAQR